MARSLKTPDSGLGPGLYETAPASFFRHPPQVTIGENTSNSNELSAQCSQSWYVNSKHLKQHEAWAC